MKFNRLSRGKQNGTQKKKKNRVARAKKVKRFSA